MTSDIEELWGVIETLRKYMESSDCENVQRSAYYATTWVETVIDHLEVNAAEERRLDEAEAGL